MTGTRHGTVAEEVARLLEALQEAAAAWHPPSGDAGEVPATCQVCPVCQLVGAVQRLRPETVQHLADVAGSFAAALAGGAGGPSPRAGRHGPAPRPSPVDVQHIDITD